MNACGMLKSGLLLILAAGLILAVDPLTTAEAGGYSDWSANRSSGQSSSNRTLKYGGTYGQAGSNYMNYRHGYGTGANSKQYSPYYNYYNGPDIGTGKKQVSPEQQQEINRLIKQSDDLINRINNDPMFK